MRLTRKTTSFASPSFSPKASSKRTVFEIAASQRDGELQWRRNPSQFEYSTVRFAVYQRSTVNLDPISRNASPG